MDAAAGVLAAYGVAPPAQRRQMARKPNYNFEKRQKETAKAKKKAEKLARKKIKKDDEAAADNLGGAPIADGAPPEAEVGSAPIL